MKRLGDRWGNLVRVLDGALRVLLKYPLCDRCLGRLFARLGRGLDNAERGRAVKILLAMHLNELGLSSEELGTLTANSGLSGPVECYICGAKLDSLILEMGRKAIDQLRGLRGEATSFLVGVRSGSSYERREQEVIGVLGLDTWESIRREVKRMVGKLISKELSLSPSFSNPDIHVVLDLDRGDSSLLIPPLLLGGRYVKLGRYISQLPWTRKDGSRKYKLSIYEACQSILKALNGEKLVLHAAGREDADARVLGDGRPMVIEVKGVLGRTSLKALPRGETLGIDPWILITVHGRVTREYVRTIKTRPSRKTYRVVALVPDGLAEGDLEKLLALRNTIVHQRTPTRVLGRRKDAVRRRRVYEVAINPLSRFLIEALVMVDGGLYVKELVDGDGGRTRPSFAELLGKGVRVVMLDVLWVEPPLPANAGSLS